MTKLTGSELMKSRMRGRTFIEVQEKFGMRIDELAEQDKFRALYAMAYGYFRDVEQRNPEEAYERAMNLTLDEAQALFAPDEPEVEAVADFESAPRTTEPKQ